MAITILETARCAVICTLILMVKFIITSVLQGLRRVRAPEDARNKRAPAMIYEPNTQYYYDTYGNGNDYEAAVPVVYDTSAYVAQPAPAIGLFTDADRMQRIVMNDLENIPFGILAMWIAIIVGGNMTATFVLVIIFTAARVLHSVCYIYALMPWRTVFYFVGLLASLALMGNAIYGVFKSTN